MREQVKASPCPFCSGVRLSWTGRNCDAIECDYCGATGPVCVTKEQAVRAWNDRAEKVPNAS